MFCLRVGSEGEGMLCLCLLQMRMLRTRRISFFVIMQVRGAARVILIDNVADRLSFAQSKIPGLEIIDFDKVRQLADTLESIMLAQYRQMLLGSCNLPTSQALVLL